MLKSMGLLAASVVLCVATAASAGAPIRGTVVKGGQNPKGNYTSAARPDAAPTDTGATPQPVENTNPNSGIGVVIKQHGSSASRTTTPTGGDANGDGTPEEHAINTKGTGSAGGRMAHPSCPDSATTHERGIVPKGCVLRPPPPPRG
jgi:hypothetical protein